MGSVGVSTATFTNNNNNNTIQSGARKRIIHNTTVQENPDLKQGNETDCSSRAEKLTEAKKAVDVVARELVPEDLWEDGIDASYRRIDQPWMFYIKSLFWIHNETGNVWTHLLSPIITILLVYRFSSEVDFYNNHWAHGMLVFAAASCYTYILSAMAHLLHSKSLKAHHIFYCLDYTGLGIIGFGSGIMSYNCSGTTLFYTTIGPWYLWIAFVSACILTLGNCSARIFLPKGCFSRTIVLCGTSAINFISSQIPIFYRLFEYWTDDNKYLVAPNIYHILLWVLSIASPIVFSLHLPERAYPGRFNNWGHGHQWFHLLVTLDVCAYLYSAYTDILTLPQNVPGKIQVHPFYMWTGFAIGIIVNLLIVRIICIFYNGNALQTTVKSSVNEASVKGQ